MAAFSSHRAALRSGLVLLAAFSASGCAQVFGAATDPQLRSGLWRPNHANHADLAAQVQDPADLTHGSSSAGSDGELAASAVSRLRSDSTKTLPSVSTSSIAGGG
jgi:type IV pilus biogenesis protein CpaD/CtpE